MSLNDDIDDYLVRAKMNNNVPTPDSDCSTTCISHRNTGLPGEIYIFVKFKGDANYRPRLLASNTFHKFNDIMLNNFVKLINS